jgi:hypothetical protein
VSIDDFEISASLRARKLTSRAPPKGETRAEAVDLERAEERAGLPTPMEAGADYEDVVVEKRIMGRLKKEPSAE